MMNVIGRAENSGVISLSTQKNIKKGERKMNVYHVKITEKFEMEVEIAAHDQADAEERVSENWNDEQYIIDAEHFKGASFDCIGLIRKIKDYSIGDYVIASKDALLWGKGQITGIADDEGDNCYIVNFGEDGTCTVHADHMKLDPDG
jgi:hypothetical protein